MQAYLQEGRMEEESTGQEVVLITKGGIDYYYIGLAEVIWKVVTVIINSRLTTFIAFHGVLHGFWVGCSTGTTSLEAKLLQRLMAMSYEVLYEIFLDLHKVYEALDRDRCLEILEGYGVGPWAHHILGHYWYRLTMVDLTGRYYGATLQGFQWVNQGYLLSPTIFNKVVDAVVCNWVSLVLGGAAEPDLRGKEVIYCAAFFYAQNGLVTSTDPEWLHGAFDTLIGLFDRVGLRANVSKIVRML